jgi:hypothetical protein
VPDRCPKDIVDFPAESLIISGEHVGGKLLASDSYGASSKPMDQSSSHADVRRCDRNCTDSMKRTAAAPPDAERQDAAGTTAVGSAREAAYGCRASIVDPGDRGMRAMLRDGCAARNGGASVGNNLDPPAAGMRECGESVGPNVHHPMRASS